MMELLGWYEEQLGYLTNLDIKLRLTHNDKIKEALKYVAIISDKPGITEPLKEIATILLDLDQDLENAYYENGYYGPED